MKNQIGRFRLNNADPRGVMPALEGTELADRLEQQRLEEERRAELVRRDSYFRKIIRAERRRDLGHVRDLG